MSNKINICVVSGSRADYGHLSLILRKLKDEKLFNLKIVVTGSHLENKFGNTSNEFLNDNYKINKKIKLNINSDKEYMVCKYFGSAVNKFGKYFANQNIDILLILGDRYEILASAIAAYISKITIAHIHGGELTEGSLDNGFRHSISKLSTIHFASTKVYKNRVIQLGENPKTVFNVGAPGLENLRKTKILSKTSLEKLIKIKFNKKNVLLAYHSTAVKDKEIELELNNILNELKKLKNTNIFLTLSNADSGGNLINKMLMQFKLKNRNCFIYKSLGYKYFYSLLNNVDFIIGNSSSGIIEAPSLKTFSINVGTRQKGRVMSKSVLNCKNSKIEIKKNINKVYKLKKNNIKKFYNPYYQNNTGNMITKILKNYKRLIIYKNKFYDLQK
tara:strand:+ start:1573 stop:2736 length:1164 start_codon:yes stop_codon:yes gene_type:complete